MSTLMNTDNIVVKDSDISKAFFIVPLDAPLPSDLAEVPQATGSLLHRLQPMDQSEPEGQYMVIPFSGVELTALSGLWRVLVAPRKVFTIEGLPGAKYDVQFASAARALGFKSLRWDDIEDAVAASVITQQRSADMVPDVDPIIEVHDKTEMKKPLTGFKARRDVSESGPSVEGITDDELGET